MSALAASAPAPAFPPDPGPDDTARLLGRLKLRLDRSFELLGERLPPLDGEVRDFLAGLDALREERPLDPTLASTRDTAAGIGEAAREQLAASGTLGRLAEGLAAPTREIVDALAKLQGLARDLKLTGLNAELAAAQLGETGRAFSVLSRDLVLLTGESARITTDLADGAAAIRGTADEMAALQVALARDLQQGVDAATGAVEGALATAAGALAAFDGWLARAGERARSVLEPIRAIMLAIQGEDLLRQGVDHVSLVLEEIDRARRDGDSGATAFEEQAAGLCATLVRDIGDGTVQLVAPVREQLDCLAATVDALRSIPASRDEVLAAVASVGAQLEVALSDDGEDLRRLDRLCEQARAQAGLVQRLARGSADLSELGARLRILEVMMRLEQARADALAATAPITQRIGETSRAVTELAKRIEAALAGLSRATALVEAAAPAASDAHRARRARIAERIAAHEASAATGRRAFAARVDGALQLGAALDRDLAELRGELVELEGSRAEAGELAAACERLAAAADRGGGPGPHALPAFGGRLGELIERFTLLSHKQLAASHGAVEFEAGDAGGTLTLF